MANAIATVASGIQGILVSSPIMQVPPEQRLKVQRAQNLRKPQLLSGAKMPNPTKRPTCLRAWLGSRCWYHKASFCAATAGVGQREQRVLRNFVDMRHPRVFRVQGCFDRSRRDACSAAAPTIAASNTLAASVRTAPDLDSAYGTIYRLLPV